MSADEVEDLGLRNFQKTIEQIYFDKDSNRGVEGSFMWLVEEVGELARSLNSSEANCPEERAEFADVLAWLASIASLRGVDLATCVHEKYGTGCPRCQSQPCICQHREDNPASS
ncbi:MAG: nucleotide pyrophosphohydrolase [Planctomycetia bacterium]|nr:nucleotide pyrophosphohydrolase [Planctomycetia bacterium]